MNRKSGSGSGIFLMEMIVVVFFFMLCASTCILAFAKSDRMSRQATDRNYAVSAAQSVAEVWKLEGAEGLVKRMAAYKIPAGLTSRSGNVMPEGAYRIYWDENWQSIEVSMDTDSQNANILARDVPGCKYAANLFEDEGDAGIKKLKLTVYGVAGVWENLFELEVSRYEKTAE